MAKSSPISARDRIVHAAVELFHLQGVKGASVDEILKKAHAGKSQFAHYFKNKEGLVLAVIDCVEQVVKSGKVASNYSIRTWSDFESWFSRYISFQEQVDCALSCPIGTIGNDLGADQELLRRSVNTFLAWSTQQIARFFAERKAAGELHSSVDPDALADLCMTVMEGGMLLSKINRNTNAFRNAAEQTIRYVAMLRS